MNQVIIGVGSNIDPEPNIENAKKIIAIDHHFIASSQKIMTQPIGFTHQPDFINCAFLVETELNLTDFKHYLNTLEEKLVRVRTKNKYGPRTIDLDIVVWNRSVVDKDFYTREFLRQSVYELLPSLGEFLISSKSEPFNLINSFK